ncbi:MAG: glycosyltransferase [Clostridia bacterium]
MRKLFVKLKHLTWRRVFNKMGQIMGNLSSNITFRKIPQQNFELYENFANLIEKISESNGSSYYKKADLTIGIITDEFMYNYYKDSAHFLAIGHDNYKELVDNAGLDLLMYVSCWRGMYNNDWYGDELHGEIPGVIRYANDRNITTIFQTIEDPTNYERYLPIARECDYIFTTDKDCIPKYKVDTGNSNVFLLEYGVNPAFHNPIGMRKKYEESMQSKYDRSSVFFAGSWMDRYKNRCRDITLIFNGVLDSGTNLVVADRNVEVKLPGYKFPKRFRPFVIPAIDHTALQKVHKLFDFNVNINTVQDSSTMCAMRVYELQALGCLMLSNYSLAVSEIFPGLFMINNREEVGEILKKYSEIDLYQMQVENLRDVMTDKTVFDRLNYIFEKCGVNYVFPEQSVIVLCEEKTEHICYMFEQQKYDKKTLMTMEQYRFSGTSDGFIACFRDDYEYDEYYLTDMLNAFKYCDVDYVTKDATCIGAEYDFIEGKADIYVSVFKSTCFSHISELYDDKVQGKGFRLDPFGVNESRRLTGDRKEIAVIIPIYNNGRYLQGRCFRSLLRSSVFDKMQIYLIDDGSDDEETLAVIRKLENRYDNVTTYFFDQGGSGSAARPRNKGIEISKEPYVTYLDPDNEAISDGYAKLYEKIQQTDVDMAFGAIFMRATSEKLMRIGYLFQDRLIKNPRDLLIAENFRSQSIQACMIKRSLITEHSLQNPEGAFGEDTFFFHELMLNAQYVYYLNEPIHMYYAQRLNSSINDVGSSFFQKSFILEKYQRAQLEKYELVEEYIERKLDYFTINWYIEKLSDCRPDERESCIDVIDQIVKLYGKTIQDYERYL